MNKKDFKLKGVSDKDLASVKRGMSNMITHLKTWDIKNVKLIDLNPEVIAKVDPKKVEKEGDDDKKKKTEKVIKHIGLWIIQGSYLSKSGKKFNFQIVPEFGMYKENTQQQYKLILQYKEDQCVEAYPQTNSDLKSLIINYVYEPKSTQKLNLVVEEKTTTK